MKPKVNKRQKRSVVGEATEIVSSGQDLTAAMMGQVMEEIMQGKTETSHIISFLTSLSKKGETIDELTAAATIMRLHVRRIKTCKQIVLDTCGTGGDAKGTFNISTASAFVASGCDIAVAKHGNRSVTSCCGSADVLEALDINIQMNPQHAEECLEAVGIAFLFAQNLHPAMKYVMQARKEIGRRTIFNMLGPLTNPAGATHQLIGVYDRRLTEKLSCVLRNLGTRHALVVHGEDGLDEITTTSTTFISETDGDTLKNYELKPEDFGFKRAKSQDLKGGSISENVEILVDILKGKSGPQRDIVVLNAAAAIYAADKADSITQGISLAEESIDKKRALEKLEMLREFSNKISGK